MKNFMSISTSANIFFLICILIFGILLIINIRMKIGFFKVGISFIGFLIIFLLYLFLKEKIDNTILYYILTSMLIFLFFTQINWKKLCLRDIYYISFMILSIVFSSILQLNINIPIWILKILPTIFMSIAIIGVVLIFMGKI